MKSMNSIQRISYLLVTLIMFQSFAAVADSLAFEPIDAQHLQHEHSHSEHANTSHQSSPINHDTNDDHHPAECHHCGHCQGTHAQWLGHSAQNEALGLRQFHHYVYLSLFVEAPPNKLLRPPKN